MTNLDAREASDRALDAYSSVVVGVADRLGPSVASLRVMRETGGRWRPAGAGSAIVLTADGFLVTSAHVVAGAQNGRARFADASDHAFEVVGRDPLTDLAIVRTDVSGLTAAELGDADELRIGQLVVAIGNPNGFGGSVSAGVVSALRRSLPARAGAAIRLIDDVIQTDAALNSGSSGGALADGASRVVGVNTAVAGIGVGLAVPINATTRRVIGALMTHGRVRRGHIGIAAGVRALPSWARARHGTGAGLEVVEVVSGGPAATAGLRPEDLVVAVEGVRVETISALQGHLDAEAVDRQASLTIIRADRELTVAVTPRELVAIGG